MRKIIILGIATIFLLTSFNGIINASDSTINKVVTETYSFETSAISEININGSIYNQVTIKDAPSGGNPGEPSLPSKGAYILLPPKSKVSRIDVIPGQKNVLRTKYYIEPAGQAVPISQSDNLPVPTPNAMIYRTNAIFPGKLYMKVGVYNFRGYQILVLLLYPVQYNPVTGELFYYRSLKVSVETVNTEVQSGLFRGLEKDQNEVMQKVDNLGMSTGYEIECKHMQPPVENYDLLIITTDSLKNGFKQLALAHNATGVCTLIKTVEDITSNPDYWVNGEWGDANPDNPFIGTPVTVNISSFNDTQAKIRNFIRDAYTNFGIDYVLLGGDIEFVPARYLFFGNGAAGGGSPDDEFYGPSDMYYSCLDGSFNSNCDIKWGESTDGEDGNDVDLYAEVYVGRACTGNMEEVNNFVSKTTAYMSTNPDDSYLKKVLMLGEWLNPMYNGSLKEAEPLIDVNTSNGYTTRGIPSNIYNIDKLYDSGWGILGSYGWSPSDVITRINNNVHIINHIGHGYSNRDMKLYTPEVYLLNNDKYCFIYSEACLAGAFDKRSSLLIDDCIAEHLTVKTSHGAFAGIWNTREGFYLGNSNSFHRWFWDGVFNESISVISKANQYSKEKNIPSFNIPCRRWIYYELTLFGDPAVDLLNHFENNQPNAPDTPSGPTEIETGVEYSYTTCATDPDGHPVRYCWHWELGDNEWTDFYPSGTPITVSHSWSLPGPRSIKVKAMDVFGAESDWSDPLTVILPVDQSSSTQSTQQSSTAQQSTTSSTTISR
ncbi:MAG: C25 family cysteine peptidase [Euryarchaeota archaeon]|nr:C25 family cysteine peptidase [Euryarchaeota archaeon]